MADKFSSARAPGAQGVCESASSGCSKSGQEESGGLFVSYLNLWLSDHELKQLSGVKNDTAIGKIHSRTSLSAREWSTAMETKVVYIETLKKNNRIAR